MTAAYALVILYLSTKPQTGLPPIDHLDKLLHFIAYGGLGFLCAWALNYSIVASWKRILLASTCIATIYGIINEIVQMYLPTRSTEILDALANGAGAVVGALLALYAMGAYTRDMAKVRR